MNPATARGRLRNLRKVFGGLHLHKKIQFNPYKNIPPLKFPERDLVRSVTPKADDLKKLLEAPYKARSKKRDRKSEIEKARSNVDFPIKEFVEFLAETGARDDEASQL